MAPWPEYDQKVKKTAWSKYIAYYTHCRHVTWKVTLASMWCRYVPFYDELQMVLFCALFVTSDSKISRREVTERRQPGGHNGMNYRCHILVTVLTVTICEVTVTCCEIRILTFHRKYFQCKANTCTRRHIGNISNETLILCQYGFYWVYTG